MEDDKESSEIPADPQNLHKDPDPPQPPTSSKHMDITENFIHHQNMDQSDDEDTAQNSENVHHQLDKSDEKDHDVTKSDESHHQISDDDEINNSCDNTIEVDDEIKNPHDNTIIDDDETSQGDDIKQEIDEFDSYGDGDRIYRKYKLRGRGDKPVRKYEDEQVPIHLPPSKIRYDHQDNFPCDKCSKIFYSRTGLLNHMRLHIAKLNLKYTCAICQDQFNSNSLLIQHKIAHKDDIFMCNKCELAFTDHCDFLIHEMTHAHRRPMYKCPECGVYYKKHSYLAHIHSHFDRKTQCDICQRFVKSNTLQSHIREHNEIKCVECNKLIKPRYMGYHMATHTGVKLFQCLYCGRGFGNDSQRRIHTRIHTDERPYECDICHAKFKQSGDMKKHKAGHFQAKLACKICDKKFIHKLSLEAHLSVHSGTQRFNCELCDAKLSTPAGYKAHMVYKHSKERKYKCKLCQKKFKTPGGLSKHKRTLEHKRNVYKDKMKEEIDENY